MKMKKRMISIILSFFIIFSNSLIGQVEVKAVEDTTPPTLNSITINKNIVTSGDIIKITVDAQDDISGLSSYIYIEFTAPEGNANKSAIIYKDSTGKYSGDITIGTNDALGLWRLNVVSLEDNVGNSIYIRDSVILSAGNFEVIGTIPPSSTATAIATTTPIPTTTATPIPTATPTATPIPLPQKCVTQNEYWTNNTINGDLYIGPQAVLTINGPVTINGNIFVLGAIKNYGNLTVTGTIYASQFIWGNSTLYNGTVLMLGGTNSVGSIVASNEPVDIPLKVYEAYGENMLTSKDGALNITGATLPIIDLYIDGTKVNYNYNGTFSLNLNVTNKNSITFQTVDVYGNKKDFKYNVVSSTPTPTATPTATPRATPRATPTPTPTPTPVIVVDLDTVSWAREQIESLVSRGIISGRSVTSEGIVFAPKDQITRAELTTLIVKAFDIQGSGTDANFNDVTSDAWYYDVVGAAFKSGIIYGTSNEAFAPNAPITRQDMSTIIIRAMVKYQSKQLVDDSLINEKLGMFNDAGDIAGYAKVYVATAAELKIISGTYDDGPLKFKPLDNANRAEAAALIYRMLDS